MCVLGVRCAVILSFTKAIYDGRMSTFTSMKSTAKKKKAPEITLRKGDFKKIIV